MRIALALSLLSLLAACGGGGGGGNFCIQAYDCQLGCQDAEEGELQSCMQSCTEGWSNDQRAAMNALETCAINNGCSGPDDSACLEENCSEQMEACSDSPGFGDEGRGGSGGKNGSGGSGGEDEGGSGGNGSGDGFGCAEIVDCVIFCEVDDQACIDDCTEGAAPSSRQLFDDYFACAEACAFDESCLEAECFDQAMACFEDE